ncbi:hypothetical protein K402DRAFT_399245 [Aulographum hederae CBS 113979]|uniref:Uncharacterized protein n=1 Tax=Aulographum hederae CBS 113979 TaxID=1176131 RepID=A0A6G1GI84_9PEZI|nr:hypothetical protein K402DRAFT_399245 [Aulographum hederae CBS 113979]
MPNQRRPAHQGNDSRMATQTTINNTPLNGEDDLDSSDSEAQHEEQRIEEQKKKKEWRTHFGSPNRQGTNPSSPKKTKNNRRFTFNREEDEVVLLEHTEADIETGEGTTVQQARFTNTTEFKAAIEEGGIDRAFRALIVMIQDHELAEQQNSELNEQVVTLSIQLEEMGQRLAHLNATSQHGESVNAKLTAEIAHVRKWKTAYRNEKKEAVQRVEELELEVEKLKEQIGQEEEDRDSSDEDALVDRRRRQSSVRRTTTPLSNVSRPDKSNNKWPDIKDYYGDSEKQRMEYPQWRASIRSKFRNSWDMFTTDQTKIDYVRDKCKTTAFNVIETRADLEGPHPYDTFEEMLKDLDDMFAEHDPMGKADAQLHSADFAMKKGERFEAFLARFTKVAAVLQLTEHGKISNCKRLLSGRLKNKINDGTSYTSYNELIQRCKQCDVDRFIVWGDETKKNDDKSEGEPDRLASSREHRGNRWIFSDG